MPVYTTAYAIIGASSLGVSMMGSLGGTNVGAPRCASHVLFAEERLTSVWFITWTEFSLGKRSSETRIGCQKSPKVLDITPTGIDAACVLILRFVLHTVIVRSARSPLRTKTLIMKNLNESDILLSVQQNSYQGITRAKKEDNNYGFSGIAVKWPYPKHSANPQLCNHPSQTAGTYPWLPHDRQITRRIIPIPESNIQLVRHLSYFNYTSRPSPHRLISAKISLPQLHLSLRQWSAILINGLGGSSADVEAAATASKG